MTVAEDRSESIRMIRNSAAWLAPRRGDFERVRALRFQEPGFDRAVWRQMCDQGWLGLRVPKDVGGAGLGMQEFCALAEELGAGLVPEPLIACTMAARLLSGELLASLISGERFVIPAWQEQPNTLDPAGNMVFRDRYTRLCLDLADHRALYQTFVEKLRRGQELGADVSMLKVHQSELFQRITDLMLEIAGEHAGLIEPIEGNRELNPSGLFIQARPTTIYGGSSEIQRNILARHVLELPD